LSDNRTRFFSFAKLSPLLQDTVLRGTFNSTLNNPILAKLQTRAIQEEKLNHQTMISTINGKEHTRDTLV